MTKTNHEIWTNKFSKGLQKLRSLHAGVTASSSFLMTGGHCVERKGDVIIFIRAPLSGSGRSQKSHWVEVAGACRRCVTKRLSPK